MNNCARPSLSQERRRRKRKRRRRNGKRRWNQLPQVLLSLEAHPLIHWHSLFPSHTAPVVQYPSKYLHGMPTIIANNKTTERYTKLVLKQFFYFPYQKPIINTTFTIWSLDCCFLLTHKKKCDSMFSSISLKFFFFFFFFFFEKPRNLIMFLCVLDSGDHFMKSYPASGGQNFNKEKIQFQTISYCRWNSLRDMSSSLVFYPFLGKFDLDLWPWP